MRATRGRRAGGGGGDGGAGGGGDGAEGGGGCGGDDGASNGGGGGGGGGGDEFEARGGKNRALAWGHSEEPLRSSSAASAIDAKITGKEGREKGVGGVDDCADDVSGAGARLFLL